MGKSKSAGKNQSRNKKSRSKGKSQAGNDKPVVKKAEPVLAKAGGAFDALAALKDSMKQ